MAERPTLRIHSPRPDILDVATERRNYWIFQRFCVRLSAFMIVLSFFFMWVGILFQTPIFPLMAVGFLVLAYIFFGFSKKIEQMSEERTPTRRRPAEDALDC